MSTPSRVTVEAPINIAFIKYWGKRPGGEQLILPMNDSFSVTLATRPFRTKTTLELRDDLPDDELWLNGEQTDLATAPRVRAVLARVRAACPDARLRARRVRILSENNFPTAAGMASSASGYCALAAALVAGFHAPLEVSLLARIGSGSACRSAHGGFVRWRKGDRDDGEDSRAAPFVEAGYWPEMRILCAVVKGAAKAVPSSAGMQRSLETSPMMASRIAEVVPRRLELVEAAIRARDFESFAAIAMAESDDLQEICRTTTPPIQYATEDSYAMIRLIKAFNAKRGRNVLGYTFDAGANCFMFTLVQDLPEVVAMLMAHFPTDPEKFYFQEEHLISACAQAKVPDGCANLIDYPKKSFEMLLESCVGSGVRQLGDEESLSKP